jgi:hypothetical protein
MDHLEPVINVWFYHCISYNMEQKDNWEKSECVCDKAMYEYI